MSKKIVVELKGVEYTLMYTRNAIKKLEADGFSFSDIENKPVTSMDMVVSHAFSTKQPYLKEKEINKLLDELYATYDVQEIFETLTEMMMEAIPNFNKDEKEDKERKNFKIVE